jgi:sugar lactone lactonase YvrE
MHMLGKVLALGSAAALVAAPVALAHGSGTFLGSTHGHHAVASTVPANGDVNPYGVAVVPRTVGRLHAGDVLVSNFNARSNLQGTGTTIVQIAPDGRRSLFAALRPGRLHGRCFGGVGLTTALVALRSGWVVVGSLPTRDGLAATARAGCLIVVNPWGRAVSTIAGGRIDGPWDMTAADMGGRADLFVTNVLNGTVAAAGRTVDRGTVVRIDLATAGAKPRVLSETAIGSGFPEHTDPAALVVGPTGVGLGPDGTLYVADSAASRIAAIPGALTRMGSAGRGRTVAAGGALNVPLGLAVTPGGHVLSVNGGDGRIVETAPGQGEVATRWLDTSGSPRGAGALFGLAITGDRHGVWFVDDATNTLDVLR